MPDRINILAPKVSEAGTFTVNTAALSVDLTCTLGVSSILYAEGGTGAYRFQAGDNFIILSTGFFVPENFVLYGRPEAGVTDLPFPDLQLWVHPDGGIAVPVHEFGFEGRFHYPFANYEVSVNSYFDPTHLTVPINGVYYLEQQFPYVVGVDPVQISMVNVPDDLNGLTFRVVPFLKVLHSLAMF